MQAEHMESLIWNFHPRSYAVDSLLLLVQGNIASYAANEFQPSFPKGKSRNAL